MMVRIFGSGQIESVWKIIWHQIIMEKIFSFLVVYQLVVTW